MLVLLLVMVCVEMMILCSRGFECMVRMVLIMLYISWVVVLFLLDVVWLVVVVMLFYLCVMRLVSSVCMLGYDW